MKLKFEGTFFEWKVTLNVGAKWLQAAEVNLQTVQHSEDKESKYCSQALHDVLF